MAEYIDRLDASTIPVLPVEQRVPFKTVDEAFEEGWRQALEMVAMMEPADVVYVTEIQKIIDEYQEQADLYTQRAKEILNEDDDTVPKYSWAISLRETYRRTVNALENLIK